MRLERRCEVSTADVLGLSEFGLDELVARLRQTPLRGFDGALVYGTAHIELLQDVDPVSLAPCQRYVLSGNLDCLESLRRDLLVRGVDILHLNGGARFTTSESASPVSIIPPIVEVDVQEDGSLEPLICDGMHRVALARQCGDGINVIQIRGIPPEYPYYAYPVEGGWQNVSVIDALPEVYAKKRYRHPENYKALFRDLNVPFPGVQKGRRSSNPSHLQA